MGWQLNLSQHPELEAEQSYIDHAYACLEAARTRATKLRSMVEVGRGGTTQARYERDVIEEQIYNRLAQLQLGAASLIFGRIDGHQEAFHIGRLAVADEQQEPVVVDWRAPIAEPFYRATGREPMGLVLRRHFISRGQQLVGIEDELFDLDKLDDTYQGHGALLAALDQNRTGELRDIVATIQGEQDEIIRDELKGLLVVQGGPGTGKTVVALHRAAYLLYTHRFPLEGQGVLVIGPNRLFLRYIERVLPSLGEAGVHMVVLADLFNDVFGGTAVRLTDTPGEAGAKASLAMIDVLKRAIRDRERSLRSDLVIPYGVITLRFNKQQSRQLIRQARRRYRDHNAARTYIEGEFFRMLAGSHRSRPDQAVVRDRVGNDATVRSALEWMWPILKPHDLLRDLFGSHSLLKSALKGSLPSGTAEALYRDRGADHSTYSWSDADVPLLDEAHHLLGPRPGRKGDEEVRTYGHIVVDEAQDHSPMALRMISRRSLNGSYTIVGDIAQTTSPGAASDWNDVVEHLAKSSAEPRTRELTLSYRIPGPNLRLALRVLKEAAPWLTPPTAVREKGDPPRIVTCTGTDLGGRVVELILEESEALGGGSIAVIVPESMLDEIDLRLGSAGLDYGRATNSSRNATGSLHSQVALVPVGLVKGLELDGSIVVEPARIVREEPQGLRALYVALTRSTKRLVLVHSEPLPPVLAE